MLLLDGLEGSRQGIDPTPGLDPDRARVATVQQHLHDALRARRDLLHLPFRIHVAQIAAFPQEFRRRIARIVLHEGRIHLRIGPHHRVHPVVTGPVVAAPVVLGTAGDDGFYIPLVTIEQEAHQRAFVIDFAVRGHDDPRALLVDLRRRAGAQQRGEGEKQKESFHQQHRVTIWRDPRPGRSLRYSLRLRRG